MSEELFYVIDISRERRGDVLMFWKPKDCGYTTALEQAGKYTREQIFARLDYYSNGTETIAVPCAEVDSHAVRVVGNGDWTRRELMRRRAKR